MNIGVISSQALIRKALGSLLVRSGHRVVVELDGTDDPLASIEKSPLEILMVHAVDPAAGLLAVRRLRDRHPEVRILLLAEKCDEDVALRALEAGVWGCLSTSDPPEMLLKALEKVSQDERWVGHRLANLIIERFVANQADCRSAERLTPREWEVLALLASGSSDKEIAGRLFISTETAKSHLKSVYKKLQVRNRSAAAVYYFRYSRDHESTAAPTSASEHA